MGNAQSHRQHSFLYPPAALAFKSGPKAEGIPSPLAAGRPQIEQLVQNPEFKNYVLSHLDDEALVMSLLQNAASEEAVLASIEYFSEGADPEKRDAVRELIQNWKDATTVGMQNNVQRSLEVVANEMQTSVDPKSAVFLQSFQRRLAVTAGLRQAILAERKAAETVYVERPTRTAPMNSQDLPHLHVLDALCETGLAYLPMFPVLLPVVKTREQRDALIDPVVRFFTGLNLVPELTLYSAWSPPVQPPTAPIELDKSSATASNGAAEKAIDGLAHTCWSSVKTRATWTVNLAEPSKLHNLQISWAPSAASATCGAPRTLKVYVKYEGKDAFVKKATFDPQAHRALQGSWDHTYPCVAENVVAVRLAMAGTAKSNSNGQLNMYKFVAAQVDARAKYVDGLEIAQRIMRKVMDFTEINFIEGLTVSVLFTLLRISGSLDIALRLVRFLQERNDVIPTEDVCTQALYRLLRTIHKDASKLQSELSVKDSGPEKAVFDPTEKTPEMSIEEDGMLLSAVSSSGYGLVDVVMDSGIWEWEMTLVQETRGDETTCLGVARRPVTNSSYDSSPDVWVTRCYNGERYHGGSRGRDASLLIHPGDLVRLTYDAGNHTLSIAVNGTDRGVLFDNVPPGVSPCVMFYSSNKSVRLLSLKMNSGELDVPTDVESELKAPVLEDVQAAPSASTLILEAIAASARLRTQYLNRRKTIPPVLEFPFSVQVSEQTLEESLDLLQECAKQVDKSEAGFRSTVALLNILEANFLCLTKSRINPAVVGLEVGAMINSHQLAQAASILNGLLNTNHKEIRRAAAAVFAAGFNLFLPNIAERAELTLRLLQEVLAATTEKDMPKMALLKMVLKRMSTVEEILALQQLYVEKRKWRSHVCDLVGRLVEAAASRTILKLPIDMPQDPSELVLLDEEFQNTVNRFMQILQEQLLCTLSQPPSKDMDKQKRTHQRDCVVRLLARYTYKLCVEGVKIIRTAKSVQDAGVPFSDVETLLQNSILRQHMSSLLHGLALCSEEHELSHSVLPHLVSLLDDFDFAVGKSKECKVALEQVLPPAGLAKSLGSAAAGSAGWHTVKASFEDAIPGSFNITDDGQVYRSVTSSNTCAVVPLKYSGKRLAWEFLLESDSNNDECSVFGAARWPVTNRCYSSSNDLWMRRAYNGYLYENARTTGVTLDTIHPGDLVRCEYDPSAGTISFSVNGGELQEAFTNVTGDVYPACGSYRSDVVIRLVKVEVYGSLSVDEDSQEERAPWSVHFVAPEGTLHGTDRSVLRMSKKLLESDESSNASEHNCWVSARGDRGASTGVHVWSFDILEKVGTDVVAFGLTINGDPILHAPLGGRQLLPKPASAEKQAEEATAATSATPAADESGESAPVSETSSATVATNAAAAVSTAPTSSSGAAEAPTAGQASLCTCRKGHHLVAHTSLPEVYTGQAVICDECFETQIETQRAFYHCGECSYDLCMRCAQMFEQGMVDADPFYADNQVSALALHSDGSLWVNGQRKHIQWTDALANLNANDTVTIRYDGYAETISFAVNGVSLGIAFGPASTGAAVPVVMSQLLGRPHRLSTASFTVYPAASISHESHALRIKSTGFNGSAVIPLMLMLQKTVAAVVGRMIAALVAGPVADPRERKLAPWLQSPLLIGGLDAAVVSKTLLRNASTEIPHWRDAWKFANDKQMCFPASDADLERAPKPEPKYTHVRAKSVAKPALFVCRSGTVQVRAVKAEAVRGKRGPPQDPFVRFVLVVNGTECDSAATTSHVKGGSFPVWSSQPAVQLTYDVNKKDAQGTIPTVVLRADICSKGMLKTSVVSSTEIDISELALKAGRAPITEDFVQPLTPQGLLALQVTHTPNLADEDLQLLRGITADSESEASAHDKITPIHDPDLFVEDISKAGSSLYPVLLAWLEEIAPEPAFLRNVLQKTDSYSFDQCERPFIAALLKHGGLITEAQAVINATVNQTALPTPSADMVSLWQRVKQLRRYLRAQKQQLKAQQLDAATPAAGATAASAQPAEETKRDDVEAETKTGEDGEEPPSPEAPVLSRSTSNSAEASQPAVGSTALAEANVVWRTQTNCTSRFGDENSCTVMQVGLDIAEEQLYVRFEARGELVQSDRSYASKSTLRVGDRNFNVIGMDLDPQPTPNVVSGVLEFDCTGLELGTGGSHDAVFFIFGSDGFDKSELTLPVDADQESDDGQDEEAPVDAAEAFDHLVDQVAARANLLLQLAPATLTSEGNKDRAKQLLLEVMERFTEPSAGPKFIRWRSQDGEDRWRGMVEVLRVQSNLKREHSTTAGAEEQKAEAGDVATQMHGEHDYEVEDFTPPQAAMQACSVFVMSKSEHTSPTRFEAMFVKRMRRAALRTFGLQALHTTLQNRTLYNDYQSLQQLLVLLKPALRNDHNPSDLEQIQRVHYLTNLEGCTAESLAEVQRAFLDVYADLVILVGRFLASSQEQEDGILQACDNLDLPKSNRVDRSALEMVRLLFSSWMLHFSSRDQRFLLQCGILSRLQELLSSKRYEVLAQKWSALAIDTMPTLKQLIDAEAAEQIAKRPGVDPAVVVAWRPWGSQGVRDGLQSGMLSTRVVLRHLYSIPSALLSSERLQTLGLPASFEEACQQLGVSAVSQIYERVLRTLRDAAEEKQEAEERQRRQEQERAEREAAERREAFVAKGVPIFDERRKAEDAKMEGDGTIVSSVSIRRMGFGGGHAVVAAYASVVYNIDAGPQLTGNYFEVKILTIADKTIGIGLAAPDSFPVTEQMPGWISHSYGYHGDDGRKFGSNSTPGDWPTWSEGDIIGCGFNFADRSIFYTRNGERLGVAFTDVRETQLAPVVGFHCQGQKVQINFGTTEFAYRGTGDVILHPAVVEYNKEAAAAAASTAGTAQGDSETKEETAQAEEKDSREPQSTDPTVKLEKLESSFLERQRLVNTKQTAEVMQELQDVMLQQWHLQKIAVHLSRFLLTVACWSGKSEKQSQQQQQQLEDEPPTSPTLVSDRSIYGTPAFVTSEDVQQLQSKLAEIIVQELLALTLYLATSIGRRVTPGHAGVETPKGLRDAAYRGDLIPLPGKPTLQSIYAAVAAGYPNRLPPVSEVDKVVNPVLEFVEVEPLVYDLLLSLLVAVQASRGLAKDVANNTTVTALLRALESGSPRVQCAACSLLRVVLPAMEPEDIEPLLSDSWREMLVGDESYSLVYKGSSRRMPDSLVRVLLMYTRNAVVRYPERVVHATQHNALLSGGFGTGDAALVLADECVSLVQELLNSSSWAEVVACHLTDVLRAGCGVVVEDGSSKLSAAEKGVLAEAATGVCASIAGLSVIRPGSAVISLDGQAGTVVRVCPDGKTLKVLFSAKTDAEDVDIDNLVPHTAKVTIDLQKLSQPLLSQLLALSGKLLVHSHQQKRNAQAGSMLQQQVTRLTAAATSAVFTLLEQQPEFVTDAMHEHELVKDIVLVALQSTELDTFRSSSQLEKLWTFVQCRLLERHTLTPSYLSGQVQNESVAAPDSSPTTTTTATTEPAAQTAVQTAVGEPVEERKAAEVVADEPSSTDRLTRFDPQNVQRRAELAAQLASETGVPVEGCITVLQYCMDDAEAARTCLQNIVALQGTATTEYPTREAQQATEQTIQHTDANPLRNIRNAQAGGADASTEEPEPVPQRPVCVADWHRFRFGAEVDTVDSIAGGVLVCTTEEEGSTTHIPGRAGFSVMDGKVRSELVVSFFDRALGVSLTENVSTETARYTPTLVGKQPHELNGYMTELDRALVILRARAIAGRLLAEGDLNVEEDIVDLASLVRLLKLIDASEVKAAAQARNRTAVTATLQSLLAPKKMPMLSDSAEPTSPSPVAKQVTSMLLEDAVQMFNNLSKAPAEESVADGEADGANAVRVEEKKKKENAAQHFVVSTPHPFTSPHHCTGQIDIPSEWDSAQVTFHEKSATPSRGASLSFYFDKEAFDSDTPAKIMYGTARDSWNVANRFASFSLVGHRTLYYRFRALPGSDKPSITLQAPVGGLVYDVDGRVKAVTDGSSAPVGLGNEDNLFALFDEDTTAEVSEYDWAVMLPDCQPFGEGRWFFEVTMVSGTLAGEKCSVGVASVDFDAKSVQESKDAGASDQACVLTASGHVRHGGEVLSDAGVASGWPTPCVVGCLFDAETNKIRFAVNGVWGPEFTPAKLGQKLRPVITSSGNTVDVNFGASPFVHPPADAGWRPVSDRPEPAQVAHESNWGFSFVVEPQSAAHMKVVREFELIWTSASSGPSATPSEDVISVWRPVVEKPYVILGDVVTYGRQPPRGAVAVHESQGVFPEKMQQVFDGPLTVHRPIAPRGYVALGDIATKNGMSAAGGNVLCLPLTLVERCDVSQRVAVVSPSKGGKGSLWVNTSGLRTFFGSASTNRTTEDDGEKLLGVGEGYRLRGDCESLITGEWSNEAAIASMPSLNWASELLNFMLENPLTQQLCSTPQVFSTLVDYLRSEASPDPIKVVPLLIRIIRLASVQIDETGAHASLPIKKIEGVCKAVLKKATSGSSSDATQMLPSNLLLLVDLAVEAQNLLEEPVIRASELDKQQPTEDVLAWHALQTKEQVAGLFGPTHESALHRLRHVLAFLRSLDPSDRNFGSLPAPVLAMAWFNHVSKCQFEESEHPYKAGRVEKTIRFPGASVLKVAFDHRSSLGAGAKLTIKQGGDTHTYTGSEETEWSNQMVIYGNELSYVFEAEADSAGDWGFAFIVSAQGSVGESEVHQFTFNVEPAALPVDESDETEGKVLLDQPITLHIETAADVNFIIEPVDESQTVSNVDFVVKYLTEGQEEQDSKPRVAEGTSGVFSVPSSATRIQVHAWRSRSAGEAAAAQPAATYCLRLSFGYKSCDQASCFQSLLKEALGNGRLTPRAMAKLAATWTRADDQSLLEILNVVDCPVSDLLNDPSVLALSRQQLNFQHSRLAKFSMLELHVRAALLQYLNTLMGLVLSIVNMRSTDPMSLGARVRANNGYVFLKLKEPLLEQAIAANADSSGGTSIVLDNFKATESADRRDRDPTTSQCTFVQAYHQLKSKPASIYRCSYGSDRIFSITFQGESGIDAGGVFREGVSRIVEDLFSENFSLLILCPNGQHGVHINTEKYVPNPSQTSPLALSMFEFVGRLMGMSLRSTLCLPFEFPSIIWKQFVGEPVTADDLMAIDATTCRLLEGVRNCQEDGIMDQETFSAKYQDKLRFVYTGSDGVEHELMPGGRDRVVTFESRFEFCNLVEERRLHEFDKQAAAIARGLEDVLPMRVLQLFSWSQLETLVAGSPKIDLSLWKANTTSSVPAKVLSLFWQVMETLTPQEHAAFIRFAWGRSRLPSAKHFHTKMSLTNAGDAKLPVSHTCFFSVELPAYSTEEQMRHGLLTAIHYGVGGVLNS